MKKIYISAILLASSFAVNAQQTTLNFESLTLSGAESYYNGSDDAGGFMVGSTHFTNVYDMQWESWNGFAYSNMTDVTTAGYLNQYSAFAGMGANNSEKYTICYPPALIHFGQTVQLDSVFLTNSTYAGISMRDGDAYAKQFGSVNGADGNPDGTNGEDFYRVWFVAHNANQVAIDSVVFYLADFRFADNAQDFILNTWKKFDLSVLKPANSLSFKIESSDNGSFGMNTPAYFALDNLSFSSTLAVSTLDKSTFKMYPNPATNKFNIEAEKAIVQILDLTGKVMLSHAHNAISTIDISTFPAGVYTVVLTTEKGTARQKMIKL